MCAVIGCQLAQSLAGEGDRDSTLTLCDAWLLPQPVFVHHLQLFCASPSVSFFRLFLGSFIGKFFLCTAVRSHDDSYFSCNSLGDGVRGSLLC